MDLILMNRKWKYHVGSSSRNTIMSSTLLMTCRILSSNLEWNVVTLICLEKAVRVRAVTNRRAVKFSKNDPNRVRAICKAEGCKWFVFASWLSDHKMFKVKSLQDEHTCAMVFKNKFVTS